MILMSKHQIVTGLPKIEPSRSNYKACILGKQTRERAPHQSFHRSKTPLKIIHNDVCGLLSQPSFIGAWYILTFTDDCLCYGCVYFLKNKSHVFYMFQTFQAHVEKQLKKSICILCNDEGGEHTFAVYCNYYKQHGIHHQFIQPNTPHQNSAAKQKKKLSWTWVVA